MKNLIALLFGSVLFGCVSDVSTERPHRNLVNTEWKLKTDVYLIEYGDERGVYYVVACVPENAVLLPHRDWQYNAKHVGRKDGPKKIVAGVAKGEVFRIVRVMKDPNPEVGTRYYPIARPALKKHWIGDREINFYWFYDGYSDIGILNPEFAEKVD